MTRGARRAGGNARLRVRVHPGARREGLSGWHGDGSLKVEVTAAPEGGRANGAVEKLLAAVLGVGKSQVVVVQGQAARTKVVEVTGLDDHEIRNRIEAALRERRARKA